MDLISWVQGGRGFLQTNRGRGLVDGLVGGLLNLV